MNKEEIIKQIKEKAYISTETFEKRLESCYRLLRSQNREDMWIHPPFEIRDMLRDLFNIYLTVYRSDTPSHNDFAIHVVLYANDSEDYKLYDEVFYRKRSQASIEKDFYDIKMWIKKNLCYSAEEFGKMQNKQELIRTTALKLLPAYIDKNRAIVDSIDLAIGCATIFLDKTEIKTPK